MATSPIGPSSSSQNTNQTNSSSSSSPLTTQQPTEQMFLQLLIAQIKNQDPTNPQDSTQFVSQLAQFSQLEQTLAIRKNSDTLVSDWNQIAQPSSTTA